MKERVEIYSLDLIRCLACLMVVAMHAPVPDGGLSGLVVVPLSLFTAPAIGLFFMVSGALLLPVKETGTAFLRRRLGKITVPVLVWTVVGIALASVSKGWPSPGGVIRKLLSVPLCNQGHGVLWFMYPLVGLYLLSPVISPWLEKASKKELQFYLALWGITLCYPFIGMVLDTNQGINGILYYFSGYLGYFILGHYLRRYPIKAVLPSLLWLPVPFVALGLCKYFGLPMDLGSHFWYLSIFTAISCCAWFTVAQHLEGWLRGRSDAFRKTLVNLSCCSFGIYLMHIFIMRNFLWDVCNIARLGGPGSLLVSFLGTLILSWALTSAISRIPGGEYIVGYRKRP